MADIQLEQIKRNPEITALDLMINYKIPAHFRKEDSMNSEEIKVEDNYKFGWSSYSEITNGRFAMIGFLSIILIELFSKQSFLKWAGIL